MLKYIIPIAIISIVIITIIIISSNKKTVKCTPNCQGKECGPDGCGGECSVTCKAPYKCENGICVKCTPNCDSKQCGGTDGCGGECPVTCKAPDRCENGICIKCIPNCEGKECGGTDGCGGECPVTCKAPDRCENGICIKCTPNCEGKECGPDGCRGFCSPGCKKYDKCVNGKCVKCTPNCEGKECGDGDGCGGKCCPQKSNQNFDCDICGCKTGYYTKNNLCDRLCKENGKLENNECICIPGHYTDVTNVQDCTIECTDNCTWDSNTNKAICKQSYFTNPDTPDKKCKEYCGIEGISWNDTQNKCDCSSVLNAVQDGLKCKCPDGYGYDPVSKSCVKLADLKCNGKGKFNQTTNSCECIKDYFGDKCQVNCPSNSCTYTPQGSVCRDGYFGSRQDPNNSNITEDCIYYCNPAGTANRNAITGECFCKNNAEGVNTYVGKTCEISCSNCNSTGTQSVQEGKDSDGNPICVCNCKTDYACADCSVNGRVRCNGNGTWNCEKDKQGCICDPNKNYIPNCKYCCEKLSDIDTCKGDIQYCFAGDDTTGSCKQPQKAKNCTDLLSYIDKDEFGKNCSKTLGDDCNYAQCIDTANGISLICGKRKCMTIEEAISKGKCQDCKPGQICICNMNETTGENDYICSDNTPGNQSTCSDRSWYPSGYCDKNDLSNIDLQCKRVHYFFDSSNNEVKNICDFTKPGVKEIIYDQYECSNPVSKTIFDVYSENLPTIGCYSIIDSQNPY